MNYKKVQSIYHNINSKTSKLNMSITLKLLYRKYNRQSLSKQTLIVLTAFTIINLFIFFLLYTFYDIQNSSSFLETNSCPTCFGFKACEKFERNDVKLTFASTIKALFFSRNFIYKGFNQDGENIVISRIENSTQIQKWEEKICLKVNKRFIQLLVIKIYIMNNSNKNF